MMSIKRGILSWLTKEERLQKYPFLRRFFWKRGPIYKRMEQMAANVLRKDVITVAFMVLDLPCWKCDSVFRLMLQHPRFRPIIWIVPELQIEDAAEQQRNIEQMRGYFAEQGYPVAELFSLDEMRSLYSPDIVFLAKPYYGVTHWSVWDFKEELVCNVPYCYHNTERGGFQNGSEERVWRNFFPSMGVRKQAYSYMRNGGANVRIVGHPIADSYLFPDHEKKAASVWKACGGSMKKIIWAPHWTISGDSWFSVATFLDVAEGMLHLAEKYAGRVQWAFKPHPLLRDTLYQHLDWGKERTDAYYERWNTMPNTQLETGSYEQLFKQSDALIHDSGSFIIEYLLVNKPCLYLVNNNFSNIDFNEDTREALACYHMASTLSDIEAFVEKLLDGGSDTKSRARARYRRRYLRPPHGLSAAQNIVNAILKGW